MTTRVMKTESAEQLQKAAAEAAELIRRGDIVGMPTETVYGLAANAFDEAAVAKIFEAKGRPQDNPLIVHITDMDMLKSIVSECGDIRNRLAEAFWPGPLTVIFPKAKSVPTCVTAGLDTVAVRMPSHSVAQAIIKTAGVPVAAPSANVSGKPSTTTADHVLSDLDGKIPLIVDGGSCEVGLESTVVAVNGNTVTVLRPGGITVEMIKAALPDVTVKVAEAVLRPLEENEAAPSPGMKHKHYSPDAKVLLCKGNREQIAAFADTYAKNNAVFIGDSELCKMVSIDTMEYTDTAGDEARHIFDYMRRADEKGYSFIIVPLAENDGMGLAVNNRLLRAAGFEVLEL